MRCATVGALHDGGGPPFDTVGDVCRALASYERGPRRDVLRGLTARVERDRAGASVVRMTVDRRRMGPSATELRRMLREVDRQLFERRVAPPLPTPRPPRTPLWIAGAAILCMLTAGTISLSDPRQERGAARSTAGTPRGCAPE